jgi:hypothetical protein
VNSVVIDSFLDLAGNTDPFEGGPDDQKFVFTSPIGPGDESEQTSNKAKTFLGSAHRDFKYRVTVIVAGVADPISIDPVVVVGD